MWITYPQIINICTIFFNKTETYKVEEYNSAMNLIDIFYPKFCMGCSSLGSYLCRRCALRIFLLQEQYCSGCENISQSGWTHSECIQNTPLDASLSLYAYSGVIKDILKEIKYRKVSQMVGDITKVSESNIYKVFFPFRKLFTSRTAIQPVPLHPYRLKTRGFNQAEYIASRLARYLHLSVVSLVCKTSNTYPQASLSDRQERIKNIKGVFTCLNKETNYDTVIVVDDIYTTGSTCREVGFSLKKNGVKNVISFTIAHG
jgi:competence protein ComFC